MQQIIQNLNDKSSMEKNKLDGEELYANIDTGSEVNIICKELAKTKGLNLSQVQPVEIKNIFGNIATITQETQIMLEYNDCMILGNFLVADLNTEK